ncbi:hypothetical protein PVAG01_08939 [Phlyctema vagabunda]|uniref:Uncharacterized protein n=1 Tax=Phlyctema vagabunda TaxID=108571 RepID=A0ABR4PAX8_9HELO
MAAQTEVSRLKGLSVDRAAYKTSTRTYTDLPQMPLTPGEPIPNYVSDDDDDTTCSEKPVVPFSPTASFHIQSDGKSPLSFPLPPKQLQISILALESSQPVYTSIRPNRRFGSCYIVDAKDKSKAAIARTTYNPGPCQEPEVSIGRDGDEKDADVFEMHSVTMTSRRVEFESKKHGRFEWRYGKRHERRAAGKVNDLLILEKISGDARRKVAQLVRSDDTRTPGTKSTYAGNGGRLDIDVDQVNTLLVLATVLVMLKKEVDRLRMLQIATMSGVAVVGAEAGATTGVVAAVES